MYVNFVIIRVARFCKQQKLLNSFVALIRNYINLYNQNKEPNKEKVMLPNIQKTTTFLKHALFRARVTTDNEIVFFFLSSSSTNVDQNLRILAWSGHFNCVKHVWVSGFAHEFHKRRKVQVLLIAVRLSFLIFFLQQRSY